MFLQVYSYMHIYVYIINVYIIYVCIACTSSVSCWRESIGWLHACAWAHRWWLFQLTCFVR